MREAPVVEQFARQNNGKAAVISIGVGADIPTSRSFGSDYGMTTPLALTDDNIGVSRHYNVRSLPAWLLLDSSGNLVANGNRFDDKVQSALDALS